MSMSPGGGEVYSHRGGMGMMANVAATDGVVLWGWGRGQGENLPPFRPLLSMSQVQELCQLTSMECLDIMV